MIKRLLDEHEDANEVVGCGRMVTVIGDVDGDVSWSRSTIELGRDASADEEEESQSEQSCRLGMLARESMLMGLGSELEQDAFSVAGFSAAASALLGRLFH